MIYLGEYQISHPSHAINIVAMHGAGRKAGKMHDFSLFPRRVVSVSIVSGGENVLNYDVDVLNGDVDVLNGVVDVLNGVRDVLNGGAYNCGIRDCAMACKAQ